MGRGSVRPVILPQPLSIGHFRAMRKGRNCVHGSRHLQPILGRLHATGTVPYPGSVSGASPREEIALQPPALDQPSHVDPDRLYQTWWWGSAHSITRRHVRFLRLHPADGVHLQPPYHRSVVQAAESTSRPLHCLGHNALFCCHIPTQGSILLSCLALMTARLVGTVGSIW